MNLTKSATWRYGVAVLATATILILRFLLDPVLGSDAPLLAFTVAVMVAAWYGGLGPGLLATGLSVVAGTYFFIVPAFSLAVQRVQDLVTTGLFVLSSVVITLLNERLQRARKQSAASDSAAREQKEAFRAERKQGEEAERVLNQQVTEVLESISDAFYAVDQEWRFVYVNHNAEQLWGLRREDLLGKNLWEVFPQSVGGPLHGEMLRAAVERRSARLEFWSSLLHVWLEVNIYPNGDGLAVYFRDITERKRAEAALQESEQRFRTLVEGVSEYALFMTDTEGHVRSWNPGVERVLGYAEAEIVGQPISRLFTPEDIAQGVPEQEMRQAAMEGYAADQRWHVRKDGTRFWAVGVVQPLRDATGGLGGFIKLMRDGTESKQAHQRLAAQYAVSQVLLEAADLDEAAPRLLAAIGEALGWQVGAFWRLDAREDALHCRDVWHASTIEPEQFLAATCQMRLKPGVGLPGRVRASGEPLWIIDLSQETNFPRIQVAVREGLHGAFAFPVRSGSGILGVVEFFSDEIRPPDDDLLQVASGLGNQIGQFLERARAQAAVHTSEALKGAILETALDCIITMDHEGRIVEFNPAAERTFGYRREEAIGQEMARLIIPPALREQHRTGLARYLATEEGPILGSRIEIYGLRKDGTEFPVELTVMRIPAEGSPLFAGHLRDITERKQTEARLEAMYARERGIAETLQRSLLITPPEDAFPNLSVTTRYESALDEAAVGGDFFDVFAIREGTVALVVGDVSGKGLGAAARTVELKYALRAFLRSEPFCARAMQRLNRYVADLQHLDKPGAGTYVALVAVVVETATGETQICRAALEPPLLVRANGELRSIETGGLPLGVDPEEEYRHETLLLAPEDVLVLFTDGITEARRNNTFFGYEGVVESIRRSTDRSPDALAQALLDATHDFAGGPLRDDACLLLAQRLLREDPLA